MKQVAILFGNGNSVGAEELACALQTKQFRTFLLDVERPGVDLVEALAGPAPDVALLALDNGPQEAGCLQGLLELLRIPYTGTGVLGSALTSDVVTARQLLRLHGVRVPSHYAGKLQPVAALLDAHGAFGYPVQLRCGPSGVGRIKLESAKDWRRVHPLLVNAGASDFVVERCHEGSAYEVAFLEGRVLGMRGGEGLDHLSDLRHAGVLAAARSAIGALGCRGPSLVRLVVCPEANEWVTDVEAAPALWRGSSFAEIARGAGYDYASLCETIVEGARLQWSSASRAPHELTRVSPPLVAEEISRVA